MQSSFSICLLFIQTTTFWNNTIFFSDTTKAQKRSKDIVKIVHVTSELQS